MINKNQQKSFDEQETESEVQQPFNTENLMNDGGWEGKLVLAAYKDPENETAKW